jgi:hypothetical protein
MMESTATEGAAREEGTHEETEERILASLSQSLAQATEGYSVQASASATAARNASVSPKGLHRQNQLCEEYTQRLRSFSSATYFAKPISLSPIVCARFGYVYLLSCIDSRSFDDYYRYTLFFK